MKRMSRLRSGALAAATLALAACSHATRSPSGFLANYRQLDAGYGTANAVSAYVKPGADLMGYERVILDPVTTVIATPGIDPQVQAQLAAYLDQALRGELKGRMKITTVPGPRTLRVRVALTDVVEGTAQTAPVANVHVKPRATLTGKLGSTEVAQFIGQVGFEGEIVDALTGERLAALIDHRLGNKREVTAATTWESLRVQASRSAARLYQRFLAARNG